jgi:hypothetical protein
MGKVELKHPSLGTLLGSISVVLSFAALIISLSSSANALSSHAIVRKGDIAPGAVTAKSLAHGAVHAKALAKGAVHSKALAKGAVNAKALAKGAVGTNAIAADAVTAAAIAPGSIYGGALGTETVHTVPIADLDLVAENGTWTASNTEVASCALGERVLGGGFAFTNPGNREAAFLQMLPFTNNADSNGVAARITTNSGGSAVGEVAALCLK